MKRSFTRKWVERQGLFNSDLTFFLLSKLRQIYPCHIFRGLSSWLVCSNHVILNIVGGGRALRTKWISNNAKTDEN